MKTIKTYEILKEIDLDPNKMLGKRFKQVGGLENEEFGIGDIAIVTRYCGITSLGAEKYSKIRITIHGFEEWEEVKEPVSFMEAVESDANIRIEHMYLQGELEHLTNGYHCLSDVLYLLGSTLETSFVKDILLKGKFYIED